MSRLRRLASCVGLVSLLWISGCGLNPQPEPPSADETSHAPAERDGGGARRAPEPDAEPGLGPPPTDGRDGGDDFQGNLDRDHSGDNEYTTDPHLPPPSTTPKSDAGTDERDAGTDSPPDASGVLTL